MPPYLLCLRPRLLFLLCIPLIGYVLFHAPSHPVVRQYVPSLIDNNDFGNDGGPVSWSSWGMDKLSLGSSGKPKILVTGGAGQMGMSI
jgi:hypothetical protein